MQRFRDLIFDDGRSEKQECVFRLLFRGFNFRVCQSTAKTAKIGSLENFRLYGISCRCRI